MTPFPPGTVAPGTVGILPAGALGVGFLYHLTDELRNVDGRVFFIERRGSRSSEALRQSGALRIVPPGAATVDGADPLQEATPDSWQQLPTETLLKPDLLSLYAIAPLPEIILACPNPDQLLSLITTAVELLVLIYEQGHLQQNPLPFPALVLASNGIYFQRFRQIFIEKLEEATLFGRLPDLWPDLMPPIISRFLRGVTIQTGVRAGNGAETIYRPGPRGLTRIAGGDRPIRQRCAHVLTERGGWFEAVEGQSATRLEFDKALVNLAGNLLGQLYAIDEQGTFHPLTVGEIAAPERYPPMRDLTHHVFQVGQRVKAYGPDDSFDALFERLVQTCNAHADHIPSSLQWVELNLKRGTLKPEITPTESWLLEPLLRYARAAELPDSVAYFEYLKQTLLDKLRRAAQPLVSP